MPASRLAFAIRRQLGAPSNHPLDPEDVAALLGYAVVWADPAEIGSAEGFCLPDELHVCRSSDPVRNRWTLAHELAHAEARRLRMDWRDERLADACAAELLLPAAALQPWVADDPDIPAIAAAYRTSLEATARRAIELRPGYVSVDGDDRERIYSTVGLPARRVAVVAMSLARRCRLRGKPHRFRLPAWDARGWIDPERRAGIAVVLRG